MILSLLLLLGMQRVPCHRVGGELKNCGSLEELVANDPILVPTPRIDWDLWPHLWWDARWYSSGKAVSAVIEPEAVPAAPEPLDVPAIQHEEFSYTNGLVTCIHCYRSTATCADKTRILEHDEQVPPLYWCRKVQTK